MNSNHFLQKAEKYKMKYHELKLRMQQGGLYNYTNNQIMDLIELYYKTYYLYIIYRYRYDNTKHSINFIDLSNLIFKLSNRTKYDYDHYYIKDLLDNEDIKELISKQKENVVFTLRQDTTKLLKDVILLNYEANAKVDKYINFIVSNKLITDPVFQEIHGKCIQIKGLVSDGTNVFNSINPASNDYLNIIRDQTNHIINIIGDDYNKTYDNQLKGHSNNLDDKPNEKLDELFNSCFNLIFNELKKD